MKKSIRYLLLLVGALFCAANTFAQKNIENDADKAYSIGSYNKAIDLYRKALDDKSKEHPKGAIRAGIMFKVAESYRMIGDNKDAVLYYEKAIKAKYADSLTAKENIENLKRQMPKQ